MDLYQVRYLCEVVNQRSYTKAAEKLNVTQPTLSIAIKKLEQELKTTLLVKEGKYVVPTQDGEILMEIFERILADVELVYRTADEHSSSFRYRTRLGVPHFICDDLLVAVKSKFVDDHGSGYVGIAQLRLEDIYEKLMKDMLDIGIIIRPFIKTDSLPHSRQGEGLEWTSYKTLECCAYMRCNHPLAEEEYLTPVMLTTERLHISGRKEGLSAVVIDYLQEHLDGAFQPQKGDLLDPYTMLRMAQTEGIAILPDNLDIEGLNLVRVPIRPNLHLELVAAHSTDRCLTPIQQELIKFIAENGRNR